MVTLKNTGKRRRVAPMARAMIAATGLLLLPAFAHAADQLLTPSLTLSGARLSSGIDPTGTPSLRSGPAGFQRFIHPVAVAGRGPDSYIADIGSGTVYRFDASLNVMAALTGIRAQTGIQLHVGTDFSLYVLDQRGRRVLHYARSGQLLGRFSDNLNLGRPVDLALDEARGRVLVADAMYKQLVAFHPLSGASYVIPLRAGSRAWVLGIAAIAIGTEEIFLSDPLCVCIVRVSPDGAVLGSFGQHDLRQPGPIAVDREQRVFVIDTFDGSLKVFLHGELIHDLQAAELGLQQINDVSINDGGIILSDGAGAGVKFMRVAALPGH